MFALAALMSASAADPHVRPLEDSLPVQLGPAGDVSVFVHGPPCTDGSWVVTDAGCHPVQGAVVALYGDGPVPFTPLGDVPLVSAVTASDGWVELPGLGPGIYRWRTELAGRPIEQGRVQFINSSSSGCKTVEPMFLWGRTVPRIECPIGFRGSVNRFVLPGAMFTVYLDDPLPVYDGRAASETRYSAHDLERLPLR